MSEYAVSLVNTRTTDHVDAQYGPKSLKEKVQAVFSALEVVGYSHQPQQFKYTSNYRLDGIEFRYDAQSTKRGFTPEKVAEARRFFQAIQYAPKGEDVLSGSPDVCLFLYPNLCTLEGYVVLDELEHSETMLDGSVRRFAARFSFVAVRSSRWTYDEVLANGVGAGESGLDRLAT